MTADELRNVLAAIEPDTEVKIVTDGSLWQGVCVTGGIIGVELGPQRRPHLLFLRMDDEA